MFYILAAVIIVGAIAAWYAFASKDIPEQPDGTVYREFEEREWPSDDTAPTFPRWQKQLPDRKEKWEAPNKTWLGGATDHEIN